MLTVVYMLVALVVYIKGREMGGKVTGAIVAALWPVLIPMFLIGWYWEREDDKAAESG